MTEGIKGRMNEDEEKEVRTLVGAAIILGFVLIGISIYFIKDPESELHYIIRGLGISIIGGAIIAWAIGHLLSKAKFKKLFEDMEELYKKISETDENINETVTKTSKLIINDTTEISKKIIATDENINQTIKKRFDLVKECEDNGLLTIYEPFDMMFKNSEPLEDFNNDVNDFLLKENKKIKLYGISLRLFFNNLGKFERNMSKTFKKMNSNNLNIKILLLSPYSDWAKQRKKAEEDFCDKIMQDIVTSSYWLRDRLRNYDRRDEMYDNIRFYDTPPDFFLFITSECVIFEIYHVGTSQLKSDNIDHVQDLGLGGHVPAFKFDSSSPMYKYLDAHFDYFFEKEKKCLFSWDSVPGNDNEKLLKFLRDELDISWAENAEIIKSDDGKTLRIRKDKNSAEIIINEKKENATLKISDGKTHDLKVKKENDKLSIYKKNEYHDGTLPEMLERLKKDPIKKQVNE